MRSLKHTSSIRDYVKGFASLMLDIPNMTEEKLLFNFIDKLQGLTKQELRCLSVQDLATAMAIEESLTNYKKKNSSKMSQDEDNCSNGGGDKVSRDHCAFRMGSSKTPNVREGKGKAEMSLYPRPSVNYMIVHIRHEIVQKIRRSMPWSMKENKRLRHMWA